MSETALTKARSMGPVAAAVQRAGGSITRVFRRTELPLRLLERPDALIPLRDQLKLVECAAREIGDDALPARLLSDAGMASLGSFGQRVCAAPRLARAIAQCNASIGTTLQSSTRVSLTISGSWASWTYSVIDPVQIGRQKNEILALGYMLDLLHRFLGAGWTPARAELPGSAPPGFRTLEDVLGCELAARAVAAIIFPARDLHALNRGRASAMVPQAPSEVPAADDFLACVEQMILLGLLERRPRADWLCRRLQRSKRSLQRRLAAHETSFEQLRRRVLMRHAAALLSSPGMSVTQVAYELGYTDPAHFTQAFRHWVGEPPGAWRRRTLGAKRGRSARGDRCCGSNG
jgi:AraC-like DNA-binding protein